MRHASSAGQQMTAHLITTPITSDTHPRCGATVLTGHAEGLHTRVDLTPLNPAGEIAALLDNLQTYTLTRGGLVHRDATRIAGTALTGPVLAEHRCHRPVPTHHRQPSPPTTPAVVTDGCPY